MPLSVEKNRSYQLARYHRMRREAIARAGGKCANCGVTGGSSEGVELGFEYARGCAPKDGTELCRIWSRSQQKIESELLRCVLLCKTCRRNKRVAEAAEERGHGSVTSYKYGCRCEACWKAHHDYRQGWIERRRAAEAREIARQKAAETTAAGSACDQPGSSPDPRGSVAPVIPLHRAS